MITEEKLKYITVQSLLSLEKDIIFLEDMVEKLQNSINLSAGTFNYTDSFTEIRQVQICLQ